MKIEASDSFFSSVKRMVHREKWYWKTWDFLRYDMPRFIKNIWLFRKDLYEYRWYSGQHAVLPFMKTALMDMASKIDERGLEVEKSKDKKVAKMYYAAFIMERFIEDDFIEIAEQELGELVHHKFEFEDVPDKPGYSRLVDNETPEEKEHNSKVFKRAREIESQMWKELWTILEGQNHSHFEVFLDKSKDKKNAWDNWFDGSGLRGWWD
jgi:hypothetical protein